MATTAPQSAPPPSASFINMEDFDTAFPDPDVTESATQNAAGVRNQPLPFVYSTAASSNAAINNNAGSSEASSSSVTSSARDLGGLNWIGKLLGNQNIPQLPSYQPSQKKKLTPSQNTSRPTPAPPHQASPNPQSPAMSPSSSALSRSASAPSPSAAPASPSARKRPQSSTPAN